MDCIKRPINLCPSGLNIVSMNSIEEALEYAYKEYDMEPSKECEEIGRLVADLQD